MCDWAKKVASSGVLWTICLLALVGCGHKTAITSQPTAPPITVEAGQQAFHLKAVFRQAMDPDYTTTITMDWASSTQWHRTIQSKDFSQSITMNGSDVDEQNSDTYMPLETEALMTVMLQPLLGTPRPPAAEVVKTLNEEPFHGTLVPRTLILQRGEGDGSANANIVELTDLNNTGREIFAVKRPTPSVKQLQTLELSESEVREHLPEQHEIIWPQALDGRETGREIFFISVDAKGHLHQALPMVNINARANESALRQMQRWQFQPMTSGGHPVQFSGLFSVDVNTRAYGPSEPLTDAEVRKLAERVVDPVVAKDAAPGSTQTERVAIDSDGILIESISSGGNDDKIPCFEAIRQWKFRPLMVDGKSMPYRATIVCKVP